MVIGPKRVARNFVTVLHPLSTTGWRISRPVSPKTLTCIIPHSANSVNSVSNVTYADSSVSSSSVLRLWKDGVMLRLGQSLASLEYHAPRRSSLVVREMCSSALAATRSMSSVVKRENSRQVTNWLIIDHVSMLHCKAPLWGCKDNFTVLCFVAGCPPVSWSCEWPGWESWQAAPLCCL